MLVVAWAAALPVALGGCRAASEAIWPVSGRLTVRGEPAIGVSLRFTEEARQIDMTASVRPDGTFELVTSRGLGLPPGTYAVSVITAPIHLPLGPAGGRSPPSDGAAVPARYLAAATSGLSITVEPGPNRLVIDLQ